MNAKTLREMTPTELVAKLQEALKEKFHLKIQLATATHGKIHLYRNVKKLIARINTLIAQKTAKQDA